ncbi:MAG: thiolase family protein [Dehalococcoidia bacterium]|jgi:acetyl-CoA C-acetyltransferase
MAHWNRKVAIVGVGQTPARSHSHEINQIEQINQAVKAALEDAQLTPRDIDMNVHGNMELFEGNYQGDLWHVDGYGGFMKPGLRVTTGGTTGGTISCAAINLVASDCYDIVMAIGFEKLEEANATTGITNFYDPLWARWVNAGAINAVSAEMMLKQFGPSVEETAAKLRVQIAENAARNPYAHLRQKLTVEDVMKSPYLMYPLRFLHMCPQSNAACCIIYAAENKASKISKKPVWIVDHDTAHVENYVAGDTLLLQEQDREQKSHRVAARRLYKRVGITDPLKEIDLLEMYDPHVYWHMEWLDLFLMKEAGYSLGMIERGETAINGSFPVNPSGGVVASNPIGASGTVRIAEAALQIRGDAGERQVTREVKTALASAFGGTLWTVLHLLSKSKP